MPPRRTQTTPTAETTSAPESTPDSAAGGPAEVVPADPAPAVSAPADRAPESAATAAGSNGRPGTAGGTERPRAKRRVGGERRPGASTTAATVGTALAERERSADGSTEDAPPDVETGFDAEDVPAASDVLAADAAVTDEQSPAEDVLAADAAVTDEQNPAETAPAADPASLPAVAPGSASRVAEPDPVAGADRKQVRMLVGLAVAAVLLIATSVVLAVGASTSRNSGPLANQAFVDSAATAEVIGQVTNAVTTVYSYSYATLPANETAANAVITGRFADEFARVFAPVKQLAPAEQAVLRSTVPAAGVTLLQGDRARLLMMVDQTGTRGTDKEPTGATARLIVDAMKVDGRWKITGVTPE